jgi:hypothetical protein
VEYYKNDRGIWVWLGSYIFVVFTFDEMDNELKIKFHIAKSLHQNYFGHTVGQAVLVYSFFFVF